MSSISPHSSQNGTFSEGKVYEFGPFWLDLHQGLLLQNGEPIKVPRKTFELLAFLVENPNQIVDKNRLMNEVWAGAFVEEANLTVHIAKLRKLLSADDAVASIETFPKVGYRFNAEVRKVTNGSLVESASTPADMDPVPEVAQSSTAPVETELRSRRHLTRAATAVFAVAVVLVGSGYFLRNLVNRPAPREFSMTRVPGTEQSYSIALSPSGEYIAHAISKGGKRTLTATHVASGSGVQLLPPDESSFGAMTFSKDGSLLYFVKQTGDQRTLYRIPFLGGDVAKVLDNVSSKISFSPDGSEFCFVRELSDSETAIIAARADGTNERVIATRKAPDYFASFDIAWSPDGKTIANAAGTRMKDRGVQIIGVDIATGEERLLSESVWSGCDGIEWISDGSGLVGGCFDGPNAPTHVWFIPVPSGEPQKITSDLNNYGSVGISADGKIIMAGQFKDHSSLWIANPSNPDEEARSVTPEKHHLFRWVRWTPDSRLLFGSSSEGRRDVWVMDPDSAGERRLTTDPSANVMPVAVPGGKHVVFASTRGESGKFTLWRMSADDGGDPVQLTDGEGTQPVVTPDGQWVYYTAGPMDGPPPNRRIWRVPVAGGDAKQFIADPSYAPDVSPDGKHLAAWLKPKGEARWKVAILPIDGGPPDKLLEIPQTNAIQWTPDGRSISYTRAIDGVSNVWVQDIDGGEPRQITKFTSEQIFNIDWSADGRLVCSRIYKARDIVLIRNFR